MLARPSAQTWTGIRTAMASTVQARPRGRPPPTLVVVSAPHLVARPSSSSRPSLPPCVPRRPTASRTFHSTDKSHDVLFVSAPLFKQSLLLLVRASLVAVPFLWRYKLFKRYPRHTRLLLWIPLAAISLVVALGLDQSERTSRWRLLLMSEHEEIEWSNQRFDELMATESLLLVPPSDPRIAPLKRVCDRLVQAMNDERNVSFAEQARIEKIRRKGGMARRVTPSATTDGLRMPYRPETGNPEKVLAKEGWAIYCIDAPVINAFVLASRDIFCYSGLLALTEGDEDLLAAVISHELIHIAERHIVESLGFLALSGVAFDVLRGFSWALTLSFPIVGDFLSSGFTFLDRQLSQRAYSRKLELEADSLGMDLMARAGYDPRAAITLWEILNEAEHDVEETGSHSVSTRSPAVTGSGSINDAPGGGGGGGGGEGGEDKKVMIWDHVALLRTHPTGEERLEKLRERLPAALKAWEDAKRSGQVVAEVRIAKETAEKGKEKDKDRGKDKDKVTVLATGGTNGSTRAAS